MAIRPLAFANALAIATGMLWLVLITLKVAAPAAFVFIFNAQFFGADVASLLPKETDVTSLLGEILAFVGGAWGFGIVGAVLYNRFIQNSSD
jgi:hypothetical protein